MKQQNFEIGKLGEDIARKHLLSKNYKIVTSNFKTKFGEIDVIALKDNVLVFVEVKLKIGDFFGKPEEMINPHKMFQVQSTAENFLQNNQKLAKSVESYRIDAICIVLNQNKEVERVDHYENITF